MRDDRRNQGTGKRGGDRAAFDLGEMALQDRLGRPLSELRLEDSGEGKPTPGPFRGLPSTKASSISTRGRQ